jgi:hypothetical protein
MIENAEGNRQQCKAAEDGCKHADKKVSEPDHLFNLTERPANGSIKADTERDGKEQYDQGQLQKKCPSSGCGPESLRALFRECAFDPPAICQKNSYPHHEEANDTSGNCLQEEQDRSYRTLHCSPRSYGCFVHAIALESPVPTAF